MPLRVGDYLAEDRVYQQSEMKALNVIVDGRDNRLYVDATRIYSGTDHYSMQAADELHEYFSEYLRLHRTGGDTMSHFSPLVEDEYVNGTRLGKSEITPGVDVYGRSAGAKNLHSIFSRMSTHTFIESGVIKGLSEVPLFVKGMGEDKMSDMVIGIVKNTLIQFMDDYLKNHNHKFTVRKKLESIWCGYEKKWLQKEVNAYYIADRRLVLVPKNWVSPEYAYKERRFYSNWIFEQQLVIDTVKIYCENKKIKEDIDTMTLTRKKEIFAEIYGGTTKEAIVKATKEVIKSGTVTELLASDFQPRILSDQDLDRIIKYPPKRRLRGI